VNNLGGREGSLSRVVKLINYRLNQSVTRLKKNPLIVNQSHVWHSTHDTAGGSTNTEMSYLPSFSQSNKCTGDKHRLALKNGTKLQSIRYAIGLNKILTYLWTE